MRRRGLLHSRTGKSSSFKAPRASSTPGTSSSATPATARENPVGPKAVKSRISPVAPRKVAAVPPTPAAATPAPSGGSSHYLVLYCKRGPKKRKKYFDGILELGGRKAALLDMEGKRVTSTFCTVADMQDGETLGVGGYDLEVTRTVPEADFASGKVFISPTVEVATAGGGSASVSALTSTSKRGVATRKRGMAGQAAPAGKARRVAAPRRPARARHDPTTEGAIVLQDAAGDGCAVVVDPVLGGKLRPHQVDGVRFMWKSIVGQEGSGGVEDDGSAGPGGSVFTGCILADEMGLGKTLQTICVVWTALKQSVAGKPLAKRVLVVVPSSLVDNWAREVKKWLGDERLIPAICNVKGTEATELVSEWASVSRVKPVLIISYEMYRKYADTITSARPELLICDEAHRLKSSTGNKTIAALNQCPARRRILLTGTPVQNDLEEFFAMMSFANPSLLGSRQTFKNVFANPISQGRDKHSSSSAKTLAGARSEQLQALTADFLLRRTSDLLRAHLPPKSEHVVCCRLSEVQQAIYKSLLTSSAVRSVLAGVSRDGRSAKTRTSAEDPLQLIGKLRLLCTHPYLALDAVTTQPTEEGERRDRAVDTIIAELAARGHQAAIDAGRASVSSAEDGQLVDMSGKLKVLAELISGAERIGDKTVVVSNFTCTLDAIARLCQLRDIQCIRLDGSVDAGKRQSMVNRFNRPDSQEHVFLLSAKAGGVGLNLIGANRLVMVDLDWNPAIDQQAMARVWRDGQRKPVHVYRLMCTGTIEEKMYQRQMLKLDVAGAVMSGGGEQSKSKSGRGRLSRDEIRQLFQLNEKTQCDTRDLMNANSSASVGKPTLPAYTGPSTIEDVILRAAADPDTVTYVHTVSTSSTAT